MIRLTSEGIVRDRLSARVSDAGVLRVKESTKLRICCVWSISQSNYLVPLFCDSMLALCSLILIFSSDMSLIRSCDIDTSDHLPSPLPEPCRGLGASDCKTRHLLANSTVDRKAQPQIAVEQFAVFRISPASSYRTLAIGCAEALYSTCGRQGF